MATGYEEAQQRIQKAKGGFLKKAATGLDLSDLGLTAVPPEIGQLTELRTLSLWGNQLTAVPPEIRQLTELKRLDLVMNQLTAIPLEIVQMTGLQVLDLSANQLTSVPSEIVQITGLRGLDLGGNQLTAVPPEIGQLTGLQRINLWKNQLTAIPPEIGQLTELRNLNLWDNQLTAVPPEIGQLTRLETLNLSENQLTAVPEWLVQMPQLEKLYVFDNPIAQPPPELLGKSLTEDGKDNPVDLEAVRRYYAQLEDEGEAYFYEAKLLLIGEGGAGKTSLARKLLHPTQALPANEESTDGIDILPWQFDIHDVDLTGFSNLSGLGDTQYTANIWDFGGQSIYYATHQFFLSKRAVYILLADTRRQHTNFYDWLQMQEAFGADSPIILLKNKNRKHGNECVIENLPHLRTRFPNLKEIIELNLNDVPRDKQWQHLLTHLQTYLLALDHIGQPRPKTWVDVRQTIRDSGHDHISRRSFLHLCRVTGITDEANALQLSDYLHNVGDILHFESDPILRDLVILNPTWALDAVYRVLDNAKISANHGQFSRQQLNALWHEAKYDGHRVQLLRLMQKFQLCYTLRGSADDFIAPQLLQLEAPDLTGFENLSGLSTPDSLQLRYKYPLFMPRGILSRAIVALHHRIADQALVWRFGVILQDEYAHAELLELRGEKEIRIRVSGGNRRDLLMEIVRTLDDLHQGFADKLRYDKLVPCRCVECKQSETPHFFTLELVNKYRAKGLPLIRCEKTLEEVDIHELVDDAILQTDRRGGDVHYYYGDEIRVGTIHDGRGVAIGRDSNATSSHP